MFMHMSTASESILPRLFLQPECRSHCRSGFNYDTYTAATTNSMCNSLPQFARVSLPSCAVSPSWGFLQPLSRSDRSSRSPTALLRLLNLLLKPNFLRNDPHQEGASLPLGMLSEAHGRSSTRLLIDNGLLHISNSSQLAGGGYCRGVGAEVAGVVGIPRENEAELGRSKTEGRGIRSSTDGRRRDRTRELVPDDVQDTEVGASGVNGVDEGSNDVLDEA